MSFTFNGISSDTMGLYVEKYPERPFPSRKQSIYSIAGRSGDLIIDENAFSNVTQTYEVYIKGGSAGFQSKATAIANWLLSPVGYATLTDSYDTTIYRKARFTGGVSFLNALNKFGKATITFDCCPQRYPVTPETLTGYIGDSFTVPTVAGLHAGYPLFTFVGWMSNSTYATIQTDDIQIDIPTFQSQYNPNGITSVFVDFETQIVYELGNYLVEGVTVTGKWSPVGSGDMIFTSGYGTGTVEMQTRRWYV